LTSPTDFCLPPSLSLPTLPSHTQYSLPPPLPHFTPIPLSSHEGTSLIPENHPF
jgi:hypothetical protein